MPDRPSAETIAWVRSAFEWLTEGVIRTQLPSQFSTGVEARKNRVSVKPDAAGPLRCDRMVQEGPRSYFCDFEPGHDGPCGCRVAPAEAANEGSDEDRGVFANRAYWDAYGENVPPVSHGHAHLRGVTAAYDAGRASLAKRIEAEAADIRAALRGARVCVCSACSKVLTNSNDFEEWQHNECGGLVVEYVSREPLLRAVKRIERELSAAGTKGTGT